ncbi:Replication factor A protein 1 [Puccinia graminis f. sp. tritici]|uniref:Replication protein A subunit n=2 Tax=Puccinia graminis f. sp. tritici TaxID=56615 RepID=E3KDM6_PUCGT|nr:uncharacterized protein PGTG_08418 [Puccinia graminis f. sp. tritici CRL 75-36-700-3]EFP82462.1 hypothetical protein PGTG_08418 [Puccinia graminis f. sp. tritici CRL 75-36-700-3]KAA1079736.1 Replication factor A protein 1 [Puccinia graminis f. sp. tritici]
MAAQLTHNAIKRMFEDQNLEIENLTVQVISIKSVGVSNVSSAPERWRIIISDGQMFITAMLATQLNHFVQENQIKKHSILRVPSYTVNVIGSRHVVVLLGVEVVQSDYPERIGNPVNCDAEANANKDNSNTKPAPAVLANRSNVAPPKPDVKPDIDVKPKPSSYKPNIPASKPNKPGVRRTGNHIPIAGVSPFANNWKIKARVSQKTEIKRWSNSRGDGKLFSVTFLDDSGQIRATGFNDAVDNLYDSLQEGQVYLISRGKITIAKKPYNTTGHDYEIVFENTTEVEECGDSADTPKIILNKLTKLSELNDVEKDAVIDVVAVLKDVGEISEIVSKATQKTIVKRDITLIDQSAYSIRMTLWGKTAETFEAPTESIVAFQGVKVGDFGGRNLSMISSSVMLVNPDIPEAFDLKGWYDNEGVNAKIQSFANTGTGIGREITEDSLKTVAEIKDTQLGMNERGDYFNFRATIMYIKSETISYPACPTERCNKKLLRDGDDEWRCEKCDKLFPAPDHRYLIQMTVQDHTGTLWLSGFNEVGQIILPMNANELIGIKETDEAQYQKIVTDATAKTYTMVCRAKEETYNDVNRTKYSVLRIAPVDWVAAGLQLAETLLKNYSA